jgi:acetyl esterase
MARHLANVSEAVVLSVGYRLAPEHPFPVGLEECYAAVIWAVANAEKLGIDANRIATAGDSAGGNLSTGVVQLVRDRGGPKLVIQVRSTRPRQVSPTRRLASSFAAAP